MRWIGYVAAILWWSGIARSLSSMNRGYKISPKPCRVPGQPNVEGTCMFVWECIKSEGTHVGVCVDTFMFGSCCIHNATSNSVGSGATTHPGGPATTTTTTTTKTATKTTTTKTTTARTGTSAAGSAPTSHVTALQVVSQVHHTALGTTRQPTKPLSPSAASRPLLQKRPHLKPNSGTNQDYHKQHNGNSNSSQITRRPQSGIGSTYEKRPEEDRHHGSNSHHHHHHHHAHNHHQQQQHHHSGFKDKVSSSHNTLLVRLPSKNSVNQQQQTSSSKNQVQRPNYRPGHRPKPFPESRPEEDSKTDEQEQDLHVQESVHRPSINSVDDHEVTDKLKHPELNIIHTVRPQWATKPATFNGRPTASEYPKPYFSVKTTQKSSSTTTQRPHSSRPGLAKPTTSAASVSYYSGHSNSAAGSAPQMAHWQVTTEPAFVTRQKPVAASSSSSSSLKPEGSHAATWPAKPQHHKPQWSDPQRPSFKPTEPQENNVYQKPHSAHYITTSYLETPTKARPTKKPTTSATTTSTTSMTASSNVTSTIAQRPPSSSPTSPTASASTSLSATTTTTTTTTTTRTTRTTTSTSASMSTQMTTTTITPRRTEATSSSSAFSTTSARTGSILTVPAALESSNMSCGVPPLFPRPETRIVGGKEAPFGKWPWQVSVRRTSFFGFSSTHRCGGAVLNENWIATAGHCVDDLLTSQIRIRVGEYDFSSVQERLPYVERGITKKVVHPKYNFFTFEYDLALVRLETPLNFAPHISPICLPASDELLIGENGTVTGWGRLSEGGTLPSILQEVSVPIVSNDRCKSMFLRAGRHEFIPEIFLCAGYESGGQDSCQGDSGGPLQVRGKDGRYFLAGIISWGIGCAEANLPGVCTRISKFVPWILKNVT